MNTKRSEQLVLNYSWNPAKQFPVNNSTEKNHCDLLSCRKRAAVAEGEEKTGTFGSYKHVCAGFRNSLLTYRESEATIGFSQRYEIKKGSKTIKSRKIVILAYFRSGTTVLHNASVSLLVNSLTGMHKKHGYLEEQDDNIDYL